jgi:phosphoribosylformimino-5-aminoimidazole carboxamide ribotide isomerase
MNLYPAIDILQGNAVRLRQGRKDDVTIYGQPLEMAKRWAASGAEWLHVVDLDGAFEGSPRNHGVLAEIVSAYPRLKIQLGGGIRSMPILEEVLSMGIRRAVIGTSAVTDTAFVKDALHVWKDRVAIGIDARDGIAKVSGWTQDSEVGAIDLARRLEDLGAGLVIYTDISRDGVLVGPNLPALQQMIEGTGVHVIASGGVAKIDDIRALAAVRHPRLDGVIVGKALYEGLVELTEALEILDHAC